MLNNSKIRQNLRSTSHAWGRSPSEAGMGPAHVHPRADGQQQMLAYDLLLRTHHAPGAGAGWQAGPAFGFE
jgi:hypothetical protein